MMSSSGNNETVRNAGTAAVGDMPDATKEREKCSTFLESFSDADAETGFETHKYMEQLQDISNRERKTLQIEMDDISKFFMNDEDFVHNISRNTSRYIRHFEDCADRLMPPISADVRAPEKDVFDILQSHRIQQLENAALAANDNIAARLDTPAFLVRRYEVSIIPLSALKPKKLREVKSNDIGHLVKIKGLVTRASDVKPQITVCTYTCETCGSELFQEITGPQFMPLQICSSERCVDNKTKGRIEMQTRGSRFIKYQELRLQELPDQVPVGHIPRSMTIQCRGEQTRQCGPGDIVTVCGVFLTVKYHGFKALTAGLQADTYLEAFQIEKQKVGYSDMSTDRATEALVREVGREIDPYTRLASSIAPEIYGHDDVKKALLLQLVGGETRVLADGMKIRGDINICLMGDPGVAKSQLLKYIATVAPRGVYTTGKGSSGVGLTAAVVVDTSTGDLTLEGGALVLADMGICCIDEFDKMDETDRTAIHEVMEQQTISIAKAGITTTLNARAAVLAAANPLYGRYNIKKSVSENVDLPNSLLSRFDLLFLLLDRADFEKDTALSKHVLYVHKFLQNPKQATAPLPPIVLKKYIAAARCLNPVVPKELTTYIVEAYVSMRQQDAAPSYSKSKSTNQAMMTARQLLSILRLSQALCRLRLSEEVSQEDVEEAIRLTHSSKASLFEDNARGAAGAGGGSGGYMEDAISAIFGIIRDHAIQSKNGHVSFMQIEAMVVKKGFTPEQLRTALDEYQQLGVLRIDSDRSRILLDGMI